MKGIKYIGFDADDTLWINEPNYKEIESKFCELLSEYLTAEKATEELFKTEIKNLSIYGFGVKSFTLSMIETALRVSDNNLDPVLVNKIILLGKELLNVPLQLLNGVKDILETLSPKYKLIVATKGDLLDQERKLEESGLTEYFHHIEIMSDKKKSNYNKLLNHLDILPEEFLMIGNSLKSDILPVLQIGGNAVHIPFETEWQQDVIEENELSEYKYHKVNSISEIPGLLNNGR